MKLKFELLRADAKALGTLGTAGTAPNTGHLYSPPLGDEVGNTGDNSPTLDGWRNCPPPMSPPCPQTGGARKALQIKVSPMSPVSPDTSEQMESSASEAWQEAFEERAAIHEFEAGMTRADAEALARQSMTHPTESTTP